MWRNPLVWSAEFYICQLVHVEALSVNVQWLLPLKFIIFFLEPSVRVELMEQVPHVAVYCYEHHSMMEAIPQYILYIVLRFLTDPNNQVIYTSIDR